MLNQIKNKKILKKVRIIIIEEHYLLQNNYYKMPLHYLKLVKGMKMQLPQLNKAYKLQINQTLKQ